MLGSLVGQPIAGLLGQRLFGHVLAVFQPLALHADILHKLRVRTKVLHEHFLHPADALSYQRAQALSASHLVQNLKHGIGVAKAQLQAAGSIMVQNSFLVTLHGKSQGRTKRDGVDAVGVAVEVGLEHGVGVPDATV